MNWKLDNHIIGNEYNLTIENMNAMIADIERLNVSLDKALITLQELDEKCEKYQAALRKIGIYDPFTYDGIVAYHFKEIARAALKEK